MRRSRTVRALAFGALAALIVPSSAMADLITNDGSASPFPQSAQLNTLWVIVAAVLVMFMQAGFAFLEIGFSRGKNAGTVVAKVLTNFSIAAVCWWACGFALAFSGEAGSFVGNDGFFLREFGDPLQTFQVMGLSNATIEAKFFFQFVFCAVSLAIVWGSTLERIKFGVYVLYSIVFAALIYPLGAHWVFGGGFLQTGDWLGTGIAGMQDFAGSTAVHLIGATGALAALLHLGPRRGKFGPDGKPRAIPGHNMPLFGLSIFILWLGWFGFNPGSTLGTGDGRFAEIVIVTNLAAACGVLASMATSYFIQKTIDIGMVGNGAIGALVAITAPSGYVELWAAVPIGVMAGIIVPLGIYAIDRRLDDPVGVLTAHGLCGIWGTIACGFFTSPRLAKYNAFGDPDGGLFYSGSPSQLVAQVVGVIVAFTFVFSMSYIAFWVIKKTYGMRVTAEEEDAGLDISEHGMYGYPEQFIPAPELVGYGAAPTAAHLPTASASIPTTQEVPAT